MAFLPTPGLHPFAPLSPLGLTALLAVGGGCGPTAEFQTSQRAVIYGADDRTEAWAHPDPILRARGRASTVALLRPAEDDPAWAAGRWPEPLPTLAESLNLCEGERFAAQPVLADCSGVLVDSDQVLTARHCVPTPERCAELLIVFDFALDPSGALLPLDPSKVHRCAEVLVEGAQEDFVILRLDRAADPSRAPIPLRPVGRAPLAAGARVAVLGHPSGLPLKIEDQGRIVVGPPAVARYRASTDTFAGSSGSAVLDSDGALLGIVVGGAEDYADVDGCTRAYRRLDDEGEELILPVERVFLARGKEASLAPEEATPACRCHRSAAGWRPEPTLLVLGLLWAGLRRARPRSGRCGRSRSSISRRNGLEQVKYLEDSEGS